MWDPRVWGQRGSFANPVPIPAGNPATGPWLYARIEPSWLPYLLGAAEQLLQPSTWDTTDPDARLDAQMRAMEAIFMLAEAAPMIPVQFQFTETCGLQVSTDGGTTWSDVPGWSDFAFACFTGPAGPSGPAGTNGRDGTNGTDGAPGTYTPGLAPNPAGSTESTAACNIAYYLAHSVVETALTQAVSKINDNAGAATFALAVMALIPGVDVIEAIVVGSLGAVYLKIQRDSVSDYETALADGALWDSITCAIYGAIVVDGGVTSTNFAAVVAAVGAVAFASSAVHDTVVSFLSNLGAVGLMQVQSIGVLTEADCSACSAYPGWCYTWDFTASDGGWSAESGGYGHYVAGVGFVGNDIGGADIMYIHSPTFAATMITDIDMYVTFSDRHAPDHGGTYNVAESVQMGGTIDGTFIGTGEFTLHVNSLETGFVAAPAGNLYSVVQLHRFTAHGTGVCPFGTPNC